jgi:hypothetical protein
VRELQTGLGALGGIAHPDWKPGIGIHDVNNPMSLETTERACIRYQRPERFDAVIALKRSRLAAGHSFFMS